MSTGGFLAPDESEITLLDLTPAPGVSTADITITGDGRTVAGWLMDDQPTPSAGYGGWEGVDRPHRPNLTRWVGRDLFQLTVPMYLENSGDSVSAAIHDLDLLASGGVLKEPPVVQIDGPLHVPARASQQWVIQDPGWGKRTLRSDFVPVRQELTLVLLEHVDDKTLAASTMSTRIGGRTVKRHHTVKHGETLLSIAAKELGDPKRWPDIATLNGLRSSGQLKRGMVLQLP